MFLYPLGNEIRRWGESLRRGHHEKIRSLDEMSGEGLFVGWRQYRQKSPNMLDSRHLANVEEKEVIVLVYLDSWYSPSEQMV